MNANIERMKVEILFDAPLLEAVSDIVTRAGAIGYTLFPALGGSGRGGRWSQDGMSHADTKIMLLTIATETAAAAIVRGLEPLLDSHGMIVMTSQIAVVREGKF
jgi:hypothetical protein